MTSSRDRILAGVREALHKGAGSDTSAAAAYISERPQGPRPVLPTGTLECFRRRAVDMASTVETLGSRAEIPAAVSCYLRDHALPALLDADLSTRGVCWPEFADLNWLGAGLEIQVRPTQGSDRLGITGTFCGVAETGTLVVLSGADTPTATILLPDTHIAVLNLSRIVAGMEDAFRLIRTERQVMPRAIHFISGPSRTGDIEQTIVLGAHGPYRVHILLVP